MAFSPLAALSVAETVMWFAIGLAIIIAGYYLIKFLYGLYRAFVDPNTTVDQEFINMFTPHNSDGTVSPENIAPQGVDPIDWLFMHPEDSAPT
jgi:hypothetical protein